MSEVTLQKKKTKLTESTNIGKAIDMPRGKGKWEEIILVGALGTTKIKSNLHTGQYASRTAFPLTTAKDKRW